MLLLAWNMIFFLKKGLKARKELNERNLKEPVEPNKSTTKDLD
jgi:hypothetical protein